MICKGRSGKAFQSLWSLQTTPMKIDSYLFTFMQETKENEKKEEI